MIASPHPVSRRVGGRRSSAVDAPADTTRFGLPSPTAWMFAVRVWIAMMLALYVAFWLQLGSASSAAVTVGILALPTRGQALQKAIYRLGANCLGVAASIVIVGVFAQSRDLYVLAFAAWMGLCVFSAGFFDGNRAYGAVLCGYTVAVVAVQQMDAPQSVFLGGVDRGAAIAVGVLALILVNEVFAAPTESARLLWAFDAVRRDIRSFTEDVLDTGHADPVRSADLLRGVAALHVGTTALGAESLGGRARSAAARNLMVSLVAVLGAARTLAGDPGPRSLPFASPSDHRAGEPPRAGRSGSYALDGAGRDDPKPAILLRHLGVLSREERRAADALEELEAARIPAKRLRTPLYRSVEAARRNGLRAFLATVTASVPFILGGWPGSAVGYALVGVTVALSALNPNPAAFALGASIAMPLAVVCAGVTKFLVLDGVDQFPLLVIAMGPPVLLGALLSTNKDPKVAGVGTLLMVFFPIQLGPANPQSYDPQAYLSDSTLALAAVILLAVFLSTLLPTSPERRRRWILGSMDREVRDLLAGRSRPRPADEAAFRDADRIGQLVGSLSDDPNRATTMSGALDVFDLAFSVRRARAGLAEVVDHVSPALVSNIDAAVAQGDVHRIDRAMDALRAASQKSTSQVDDVVTGLIADLARVATLMRRPGLAKFRACPR